MTTKATNAQNEIDSIDLIFNEKLDKAFNDKKKEFSRHKIPSEEVLAFHGTASRNIESILEKNLQLSYAVRQLHGPGNYFSEFPDTSMGYGDGLILFRVLPGKEYEGPSQQLPPDYNCKKVGGNTGGFGQMLVIEDSSQFVPYAVYHLKKQSLYPF